MSMIEKFLYRHQEMFHRVLRIVASREVQFHFSIWMLVHSLCLLPAFPVREVEAQLIALGFHPEVALRLIALAHSPMDSAADWKEFLEVLIRCGLKATA
jgi:hypothetical protein